MLGRGSGEYSGFCVELALRLVDIAIEFDF
jgi:hypothetical protein